MKPSTVAPSYPMVKMGCCALAISRQRVMPGLMPGIHDLACSRAKTWMAGTSPAMTKSVTNAAQSLAAAIVLDAGGAQARKAVLVDRSLPAQELVHRQGVALAGLFKADQPAAHGGNHLGLAADDPPLGVLGREIGDGQRAAVGADHISDARPVMLGHRTHTHHLSMSQRDRETNRAPLRFA